MNDQQHTPTTQTPPAGELPPAIAAFLREYMRQRGWLLVCRELLVMIIMLVGWLLLCCLADRALQLTGGWRGVLLGMTLAGVAWWVVSLLRHTVLAKMDENLAALELEHLRPDLDERLATICSRLQDRDGSLASREMLDAIASQVEGYIGNKGLPRLVSLATLGRHVAGAMIVLIAMVGLSIVPLLGLPRLMARLGTPWRAIPPVTTTQLHLARGDEREICVQEGDAVVLDVFGERVGDDGVTLHYSTDGKTWASRSLVMLGANWYQTAIGPVRGDQQFFISSGDAVTPATQVRVMRKPAVAEFRIRYEYPAYLKREAFAVINSDGLIEAPVGTKATVTLVATDKLASARIKAKDLDLPLAATIEPTVMRGELTLKVDQSYTLQLVSQFGLEGAGPDGSRIHAIPDRPPFVRLVSPVDDLRLSPRDITPLKYQAIDDYGVNSLVLRVQVNSAPVVEVPLKASGETRRLEGTEELDLANLRLKIGDVVAITLAATDGASQNSASETRYIFVSPHSVEAADYERLAELQNSLDLSRNLAKEVESSIHAMDQARSQANQPDKQAQNVADYQQHVAQSGEEAEALKKSLSRAITTSADAKQGDMLATMADRAQVRAIEAHDLVDELGKGEARENNTRERLGKSLEQTRQMQKDLETLVSAEKAAAAMADRRNVQAAQQASQSGKMTQRAAEMLSRMQQDVADQTRQLGLNPDEANVEKQLENKVQKGQEVQQNTKAVDFVDAARTWANQLNDQKNHPPMFDRRLAAAADVESVRPDGDLVRARDLNFASKASQAIWAMSQDSDPQTHKAVEDAKKQFVDALAALEKRRGSQDRSDQQAKPEALAAAAASAAAARQKMSVWAGESDPLATPQQGMPDDPQNRQLALDANAAMAQGQYDLSGELQKRMALDPQLAAEANREMQQARTAEDLRTEQEELRRKVAQAEGDPSQYAQRQRELAMKLAQEERGEHAPQLPRDTRAEALKAIGEIQQKLAQMPQQLQRVVETADVQFQAHDLKEKLASEARQATEPRKQVAQHSADRAVVAEQDARKETDKALAPVDPDVAKVMSAGLIDYMPETTGATQVLEQKLLPALDKVKQSVEGNKGSELVRGVKQAREAIADAQRELRNAQQALLERDPLFAAKVYADAAAEALSRVPPDMQAAMLNQQLSAQALGKQQQTSAHQAAAARLAGTAQMAVIYQDQPASPLPKGTPHDLANVRQWGALRLKDNSEASAPDHDVDPGGYQAMLQVYFRTLGKAREKEHK